MRESQHHFLKYDHPERWRIEQHLCYCICGFAVQHANSPGAALHVLILC